MHLLTQSALLRALGWSLLNSLWQMAFLWLVYVVLINIFRRSSANVRHGMAVFLLGAGTIWTVFSFFNVYLSDDMSTTAYQLGMPLFPGSNWAGHLLLTGRQLINEWLPYCSTLYLLTLFFLFVRYGKQYLFSRKLTYAGLSKVTPDLRVFVEATGRKMGIKKEVKVWFSSLVEGPVTLGALKPVILIPLATVTNLTPQQVEALILHELAHIRRQDYLLNLWIAVLEVLFFFNPFSGMLIRSIQKEREHRCDDLVMQFRYDPHTYVSALMALARGINGHPRLVLAATGSNDRLLLQRVRRILKLHNAPEPLKRRSLVFLFFTLFMTGMLLSHPAAPDSRMTENGLPALPAIQADTRDANPRSEIRMIAFTSVRQTVHPRHEAISYRKLVKMHNHHIETSEDVSFDYSDQEASQTPDPSQDDDDDDNSLIGYASTIQAEKRDYSIASHIIADTKVNVRSASKAPKAADVNTSRSGAGCALQIPAPYVPNSSFSCQDVQDSTTLPGEKYVYLQQMATQQVAQAVARMQKELQVQLKLLEQSTAREKPELRQQRQILLEQLKLQQQYLEKQQQLQKKLERVGKKKVIVVI